MPQLVERGEFSFVSIQMAEVLLVEDHELTHRVLCDVVHDAGHSVCCVKTKRAAERRLASARYDLLVADVLLPDGSGYELAEKARRTGIRSLLITGHPEEALRMQAIGVRHLRKPFGISDFLETINDVLEETEATP